MAIILLGADGIFPAGALRACLQSHLPEWRWTCGEEDDGVAGRILPWRASQFIRGRALDHSAPVYVELRWQDRPLAGRQAPMHSAHVTVGQPTTEDARLADQIIALIASALLDAQHGHGWAQLAEGGSWLRAEEATRLTRLVIGGEPLSIAAGLGKPASDTGNDTASTTDPAGPQLANLPFDDLPPAQRSAALGVDTLALAGVERAFAEVLASDATLAPLRDAVPFATPPAYAHESPSAGRLPTLVLLFTRPPQIDWAALGEGLRLADPAGDWSVQGADGAGEARGVDAALRLCTQATPMPAWLVEPALDRSFWVRGGDALSDLRRHRVTLTITPVINCAAAGPDATRAVAKAMVMALALLARNGPCAGVYNAATAAIFTAEDLDRLVAPLGMGEVSIPLFIWTAFHATAKDAVSLSTAGMMPFIGMEVEAWNAPGDLDYVGEKLNGVLRYLLLNGPVIAHGDSIGESEGDYSLRCFLGDSRAERPYTPGAPVPALLLEFAGPAARPPQPDRPVSMAAPAPAAPPAPKAEPKPPAFGRRNPPSFGRKGL